jgi:hypothetical protein
MPTRTRIEWHRGDLTPHKKWAGGRPDRHTKAHVMNGLYRTLDGGGSVPETVVENR